MTLFFVIERFHNLQREERYEPTGDFGGGGGWDCQTGPTYLTKGTFSNHIFYFVSVEEPFTTSDDVVVILVIVTLVKYFTFLLMWAIFPLGLLRSSFLLCIIHLKDRESTWRDQSVFSDKKALDGKLCRNSARK